MKAMQLNAKGGISMKQYEDIKKISGIEIAAPIANLGHYANGNSVMMVVTRANQASKMDVTFKTYDGPNVYDIEKYTIYQTSAPKGVYYRGV